MISTLLVEQASVVPFLIVAMLAGLVLVGWLLARRGDRGRWWAGWATAASVVAVAVLTLLPDNGTPVRFCSVSFSWPWSIGGLGRVESLANLVMLFPAAFFSTVGTRRPVAVAAAASGFSAGIELVQALVPAIGRSCDTNDWEMNSIGAVVGALTGAAVLAFARRTTVQTSASARSEGLRRWVALFVPVALVAVVVASSGAAVAHVRPPNPALVASRDNVCGTVPTASVRLPDGSAVHAAFDGGLCVLMQHSRFTIAADASGPQTTSEDGRWRIGVAQPGGRAGAASRGGSSRVIRVEGSKLTVWATPIRPS